MFVASSTALDAEGSWPAVFGWVTRLDARTGAVRAARLIHDGDEGPPAALSTGSSGLWALSGTNLVRFDPDTLETLAVHPASPPTGTGYGSVAVGDGAVYAANAAAGQVSRFAVTSGERTHQVAVARRTGGMPLAFTGTSLWAGGQDELVELDPADLSVRRRVPVRSPANELTHTTRGLWAYAEDALYVVRPDTAEAVRVADLGGTGHWGALTIAGRYAWLADYPNGALWRVTLAGGTGPVPTDVDGRSLAHALADKFGCENTRPGEATAEDVPAPAEKVDCVVGEAQMSVQTYSSAAELEAAVASLNASGGCGFRAVGDTWLVAVNTPESATLAAERLGGRFVELAGC